MLYTGWAKKTSHNYLNSCEEKAIERSQLSFCIVLVAYLEIADTKYQSD